MTSVFSAQWFEQHQAALLTFANTKAGRYALRVHGKRSAVGGKPIIRIEPHAITWTNPDGSYSTEYRTHDKFSKRLYHAFKPVWYGAHAWDMAVANKLAPSLNLGFDTLTAYPEAGNGTMTVDGAVARLVTNPGETFSALRSGSGTDYVFWSDIIAYIAANTTPGSNTFTLLERGLMTFDTTSIPVGSTISSATLSMHLNEKFSNMGSTPLHIVNATPNQNNRLSAADYQNVGTTSLGFLNDASIGYVGYNNFTLNASGIANVNMGGISRFGTRLGWDQAGSFTGTWVTGGETYYFFSSADTSGTTDDPKLVVTYSNARTTSASGTLLLGGGVTAKGIHKITGAGGTLRMSGQFNISKDVAPIAGKEYVYRVYREDGTYIGIWPDVEDTLQFSQRLNTPGTTTTVRLARSANAMIEKRDTITTISAEVLTTQAGDSLVANYVTNQTVGEDTDVFENHNVDVYVHYGGFETLETQSGETLTDQTGDELLFPYGAPLGRRVFSGFILDYAATYGEQDGVEVTLMSHGGWELANEEIRSGSTTTITYSATDHGQVIRDLLAMNSTGKVGSGTSTVANTGSTITPTFRLNSLLEGIEEVHRQSPAGWYWYGNVAENQVYFQQKASTPHHTFVMGKHIKSLKVSKSIENLKNTLFFVGGDPGTGVFYKKYTHTSSVSRKGLDRQTDRRVWLTATGQKRADKTFDRFGEAIYTTQVTIPSEVYDIESIELGQTVGFANAGNFIDSLVLQIVNKQYSAYTVTLDLGELLDRQSDIIDDTASALSDEQYTDIPSAPS